MLNPRHRFLVRAMITIIGIWVLVMAGHWYFEGRKMTAEKVRAYVESVNFGELTGAPRTSALKNLAAKLNALPYSERQRLRSERLLNTWFAKMTDAEKTEFVEATLPTGIKQMIAAFEQLPEEKRRHAIDDALKNLRNEANRDAGGKRGDNAGGPPPINPELEARIRTLGLQAFYSQSSAQTKAEVAPLLEELQRQMESGRMFRR